MQGFWKTNVYRSLENKMYIEVWKTNVEVSDEIMLLH